MKKIVRQMLASITVASATTAAPGVDARLTTQRAAVAQGALVDLRHG